MMARLRKLFLSWVEKINQYSDTDDTNIYENLWLIHNHEL